MLERWKSYWSRLLGGPRCTAREERVLGGIVHRVDHAPSRAPETGYGAARDGRGRAGESRPCVAAAGAPTGPEE